MPTTMVHLRAARVTDAETLCRAQQEIAATPGLLVTEPNELMPKAFRHKIEELSHKGLYLVVEVDGVIAGHLWLDPLPLAAVAHVFHLTMAVHSGYQNQGLGRRLLTSALEWARYNAGKVELLVRATNAPALRLYQSAGFTEEGRFIRRIKLPDGTLVDDVAMGWHPSL